MFKRKIKKLNYKILDYRGLKINFARNFCRSIHMSISRDGKIKYVVPYGTSKFDIYDFLDKKYDWVLKQLEEFAAVDNKSDRRLNKKELNDLKIKLEYFVSKYEGLMNTKVENTSIRKMRTIWGSCTWRKKSIRFNTELYFMPDDFIEYIVVHEMAHLFIPNHSKSFYDFIKRFLPDYKNRIKLGKKKYNSECNEDFEDEKFHYSLLELLS